MAIFKRYLNKKRPLWAVYTIGIIPISFFLFFRISIPALIVFTLIYGIICFILIGPEMLLSAFLFLSFGLVSHSNPYNYSTAIQKSFEKEPTLSYEKAALLKPFDKFKPEKPVALFTYAGSYTEKKKFYELTYHTFPIVHEKKWQKEMPVLLWGACNKTSFDDCVKKWEDLSNEKLYIYPIYTDKYINARIISIEQHGLRSSTDAKIVEIYRNREEPWQWVFLFSLFASWFIGCAAIRKYVYQEEK